MRRACVPGLVFVTLVAAGSQAWRVAPEPPASWQRDRIAELSARRAAVRSRIGPAAMLLLYAAAPRNYSGDVNWPYRQENNFFYLTGISQAGGALVLVPDGASGRSVLFLPPPDPARETWSGHMLRFDEATAISGIEDVRPAAALNAFLTSYFPRARAALGLEQQAGTATAAERPMPPELYLLLPGRPEPEYTRESEFATRLAAAGTGVALKDATPVFTAVRAVKSPYELALIQHAIDITAEAFERIFAKAEPGAWEYELQAQFEFTYLRRGGRWGYPPIVGSGGNATTLHYEANRARIAEGSLILMDDAAEFDGYSADVTRTIPASGRFTREQAQIYRLVWTAQQAAIAAAFPGHAISGPGGSLQSAANDVFRKGLVELGLMTDAASDAQLRLWFPHGISHSIGLNVHDPSGRELAPGMVVTAEPGLYFRPDALDNLPRAAEWEAFAAAVRPAFERYKGIGVRIEDDLLITHDAPRVLSAAIPSRLEDVETAIAKARKRIKTQPLP